MSGSTQLRDLLATLLSTAVNINQQSYIEYVRMKENKLFIVHQNTKDVPNKSTL